MCYDSSLLFVFSKNKVMARSQFNNLNIIKVLLLVNSLFFIKTECKIYEATWESLDTRPMPQWIKDINFGIFIHWSIYSVPSFEYENDWLKCLSADYQNYSHSNIELLKKYYKSFAKDFTTELFNATKWVQFFESVGAQIVVMAAKHADGFTLWPSTFSPGFNSMDIGPHRDLVGEMSVSIRSDTDLKFGVYYSFPECLNEEFALERQASYIQNNYAAKKHLPELKELLANYQPDLLWSSASFFAPSSYWKSTEFLSWLYNESPVKDTVVTSNGFGNDTSCTKSCYSYSWYKSSTPIDDDTISIRPIMLDKISWHYRASSDIQNYLTSKEIIEQIVETISTGTKVLLNIGPTRRGNIPAIFEDRLRDVGRWLKINGEAIFRTKSWLVTGDIISTGVYYTTEKKTTHYHRTIVYAIIVNYPYDRNIIALHSLGGRTDDQTKISLLGYPKEDLHWISDHEAVQVQLPAKHLTDKEGLEYAWVLKIDIPDHIANLTPTRQRG